PLGRAARENEAPVFPNWAPGPPDVPNWANDKQKSSPEVVPGTNGRLVALAGHANFVAGAIAITSRSVADLTIQNLNGAFSGVPPDELPTEANITHAIAMSAGAAIINVSFAGELYEGVPGESWAAALTAIGPDTVVVCPAGNEQSTAPHYPAALHAAHPQVIGVGSWTPKWSPVQGNSWSNGGKCLTC